MSDIKITIKKLDDRQRGHSAGTIITAEIPVGEGPNGMAAAIKLALSPTLKDMVCEQAPAFGLAGYGVQKVGSYEPIRDEKGVVTKYYADFKFTKSA